MADFPLVSCLCLTYNKPEILKRAIDCFQAQTYPNKELLIVYTDDNLATKDFLQMLPYDNIKYHEISVDSGLTLGEKRNLSIEVCTGEYFCNWDDDDWSNTDRIAVQMEALKNSYKTASILINVIIYDMKKERAYLSHSNLWEPTVLSKKSLYNDEVRYLDLNKGEDTHLVQMLAMQNALYPVLLPTSYIYVYHGNNTWNYDHFQKIFLVSQKLSDNTARLVKEVLDGKYTPQEGSQLLKSAQVVSEFNYFHASFLKHLNKSSLHKVGALAAT